MGRASEPKSPEVFLLPWEVRRNDKDEYCVHKSDSGELVACHASEQAAKDQMAALYANAESLRTAYFGELIPLAEGELAKDAPTVRVTLIRPGWSANGRYYAKEVLGAAAPVFEGTRAFADHGTRTGLKEQPERSVHDLVGFYEKVRQEADGRLTGDLTIVDERIWPKIKTAVERRSDLIGLSINALGKVREGEAEGKTGMIVENIVKAPTTSIDVVTIPAAGGRFERLLNADTNSFSHDLIQAMSLAELKETLNVVRPDLVKAWKAEWQTIRTNESLDTAREELKQATSRLKEAEKDKRAIAGKLAEAEKQLALAKREAVVDKLLAQARLPKEWQATLREQLVRAADEKNMLEIVERERKKAAAVKAPIRVTGAGSRVSETQRVRAELGNPLLAAFGVDKRLARAQTFEEYKQLKESIKKDNN